MITEGKIICYNARETDIGLAVDTALVLTGPEDGVTVLPVKLPEYGIDILIPFHNSIGEFCMLMIKNVPSVTRPEKPYRLNVMPTTVTRIPTAADTAPAPEVRGAQWLKDYYESHNMQPEAFGELRLYGPVEMAPGHLLAAVEMSFVGDGGTVVPLKLPQCGLDIRLGIHQKLQENQPFVIPGLTDPNGDPYDLTVVAVRNVYSTGGSGGYARKRMAEADPKAYVKKLTRKQIGMLAGKDLEQAAVEMYLDRTLHIGQKALVSEHFLFHKSRRRFIIPCEDILWFYDDVKGRFFVGTRSQGIVKISRSTKSGEYYQLEYKHCIQYLRERTEDLLVGETAENAAQYQRRRYQK